MVDVEPRCVVNSKIHIEKNQGCNRSIQILHVGTGACHQLVFFPKIPERSHSIHGRLERSVQKRKHNGRTVLQIHVIPSVLQPRKMQKQRSDGQIEALEILNHHIGGGSRVVHVSRTIVAVDGVRERPFPSQQLDNHFPHDVQHAFSWLFVVQAPQNLQVDFGDGYCFL
ncbi:hypothetical protein OGAPHI_006349 [Ogataea philodendri]|uniref:Uncharacterized protein n=1 Tax=Ogataea philodendri TaxID=1378263 RepID=A0A9P8NXR6_9ASCO|nr:uncharacterized protein OGAPHI_006349 [Ogataea philodendri]KAH3661502.1 hypothetical protein OGAPHI_006349 [Ogataea philodendri]